MLFFWRDGSSNASHRIMKQLILILISFHSAFTFAKHREQVEIRVNASFSAQSHWTEAEIRNRFRTTSAVLSRACPGIQIVLNEIVRIEDRDLQDIDGSLTPESVDSMKRILSRFKSNIRPILMFGRQAKRPNSSEFTEFIGQAYMLGGPRPGESFQNHQWNDPKIREQSATGWDLGNLDWNRLKELRSIHGVIVIGQASSIQSPYTKSQLSQDPVTVDRHELGHVLTNDGSHRYTPRNILADKDRTALDQDQCELIQAYHLFEVNRDGAIKIGMQQLCALYDKKNIPGKPDYCDSPGEGSPKVNPSHGRR